MTSFRQTFVVTKMNLLNLPQRLGSSLVVIIGNIGVVVVLISVLAMGVGFRHTINGTGREDRAIVMRGGANSELTSVLLRAGAQAISDAPGVKLDAPGQAMVSPELVMVADIRDKDGSRASVTLRGVGLQSANVRPEVRIIEGRMFEPGKDEVIVGLAAQRQFKGLAVGQKVNFGKSDWLVVGTFDSRGDLHESEVMADVENVASAFRRNSFNSATVVLDSKDSFDAFKGALTSNPTLSVQVVRETDYYAALSEELGKLLTLVGAIVGSIMSIGAIFGALNTMYAAVSTRTVEIATLRAMGFSTLSVVISVIVEALFLALTGGAIGALLAWVLFNGNAFNTLGSNYAQVVFHLMVTPALIMLGLVIALCIGLVGGLVPAARAARLPVATALRAL